MRESDPSRAFIDKWRARWPEWNIGQVFLPAKQRDVAFAWFALLQELIDAAWTGDDATPGLAKLAWWSEELQGWAKGARRHPLGASLQPQPAPWSALAAALRSLQATRERSPDIDGLRIGLAPFVEAAARCEALVSGQAHQDPASLLFDLCAERCLLDGDVDAAATLLRSATAGTASDRARRMQSAFLRERLRNAIAGKPQHAPGAWRSLWQAWRAARAR
jgi:hypothetical protein